ncbi:hypothetical protein V865_000096 [Kwoniella europaea PYCC6329]|uniref:Uncharacterized protein n=1 Tax=Kwoniella europaea PYCC6329 TaxID=1423913 RepID=A0AAX4K833_9TREE
MHLEESNRDEGWGGDDRSIAGSKAFAWKRMRYTDEIKIYCHDLNQRILRFKGDLGSALGGGMSMFMPQVVASKEEDISKKRYTIFDDNDDDADGDDDDNDDINQSSKVISRSRSMTEQYRPIMLFDGGRLPRNKHEKGVL